MRVPAYDLYQELEVARTASADEISAAYRRLARQFHPDVNPSPEAAERMLRINQANDVLSDPVARAEYDNSHPTALSEDDPETADTVEMNLGGQRYSFRAEGRSAPSAAAETMDVADIFQAAGGRAGANQKPQTSNQGSTHPRQDQQPADRKPQRSRFDLAKFLFWLWICLMLLLILMGIIDAIKWAVAG